MAVVVKIYKRKVAEKAGIIIFTFTMVIIFTIFFTSFYKRIYSLTIDKNMNQIEEQSDNVIKILKNEIDDCTVMLSHSEKFITSKDEVYSEEVLDALHDIQGSSEFTEIGILDNTGKMITSEKKEKRFIYNDYFKDIEKDEAKNIYKYKEETYISDVFIDQDSKEKIMFLVPIKIDNEYEYCIYGEYELDELVNNFLLSINSERYFQIIDNEGKYIYSSENKNAFSEGENIWKELKKYKFYNKKNSVESIYKNIRNGKKGEFYFEYNNEGRYVSYKPIGISNWYIFSIQTEKETNAYIREVWNEMMHLLLLTTIILILIMIAIVYYISHSKNILLKKDEQISIQNSVFKLVLNKAENIPFEVDLSKGQLTLYLKEGNNPKKVDLKKLAPDNLIKNKIIKEEDYKGYEAVFSKILKAEEIKSDLIHMKTTEKFSWIKVNTVVINKSDGSKHIVGILEDYNEQMDKEEKIKKHIKEISIMDMKNKTDFLTSIFNREGFIQEMNYYLSFEKGTTFRDVFLILDLDNFKAVNDLLGHGVGDEVLIETADIIKKNLSKKDIVGRLAGDEFVAFVRNIEERKDIESIASRLNKLLCREIEKNGIKVSVSSSIGMAVVEKEDKKFEDLYEKADIALYQVKNSGKNSYRIYDKYEKGLK